MNHTTGIQEVKQTTNERLQWQEAYTTALLNSYKVIHSFEYTSFERQVLQQRFGLELASKQCFLYIGMKKVFCLQSYIQSVIAITFQTVV